MRFSSGGRVLGWMAVLVVGACGGKDFSAAPSDGGSPEAVSSNLLVACQDACSRCSSDLCADCARAVAGFLPDFASGVFACVSSADACASKTWENCMSQVLATFPTRPIDTSFKNSCLTRHNGCLASGDTFADDICYGTNVLTQATVLALGVCLTKPCAEIDACVRQRFP